MDAACHMERMRKPRSTSPERAQPDAVDDLLDRRIFVLDSESFDAFRKVLDDPPPPGPKLQSLLRRVRRTFG
jgi:uncharacterized protein (DUF1778 family)